MRAPGLKSDVLPILFTSPSCFPPLLNLITLHPLSCHSIPFPLAPLPFSTAFSSVDESHLCADKKKQNSPPNECLQSETAVSILISVWLLGHYYQKQACSLWQPLGFSVVLTFDCVYLGLMLLSMEKGESDGVCWISRLCMCSREVLVKNVPHLSSVFERTINPHSSNAYIVLCTYRPFWPYSG